jgi:short-subunit dehydrogenase
MESKEKQPLDLKKVLTYGAIAAGGFLLTRAIVKSVKKFKVKNKVVLVTGGSRGLGLVLARQLAEEKAKLVICARDEQELHQAAEELSSKAKDFMAITCDLRDKLQIKKMIAEIEARMGPVEILINNAGMIQVGPMEEMKEEDYDNAMKIHFWAPFHTIQEVLPGMQKNKKGRIVNVVSVGGKVSFPHLLPYNASKFALSGLSEGLTVELEKYNIKVTTVYPGLMTTGSPRNIDVKGQHEKEYSWFSIADSLPILSMDANKAAKKILKAMKEGEKTLTLTASTKVADILHSVSPDLTISFFELINSFLPEPDGTSKESKKGYESQSKWSPSVFTGPSEEAAVRNNEM